LLVALGILNNWIFVQSQPLFPQDTVRHDQDCQKRLEVCPMHSVHNYARAGGAASRSKVLCLGHLERLGLQKGGVKKMFQALHIAATHVGVPPSGGTCDRLKPGLQRGPAQARKNVQIASGCIKIGTNSAKGGIEMLFGSFFAAKDCGDASARDGRNEDLEKLYQKRLFVE
jgi:hypothetical protein